MWYVIYNHPNPWVDSDGDGLLNSQEQDFWLNPFSSDTDGDGLDDYVELFINGTFGSVPDTDNDGLTDHAEKNLYGTDPNNPGARAPLVQEVIVERNTEILEAAGRLVVASGLKQARLRSPLTEIGVNVKAGDFIAEDIPTRANHTG
jgi:hypothetical protein